MKSILMYRGVWFALLLCAMTLSPYAISAQQTSDWEDRSGFALGLGVGSLIGVDNDNRFTPSLAADINLDIPFTDLIGMRIAILSSAPFDAQGDFSTSDVVLNGLLGLTFRGSISDRVTVYGAFTVQVAYAPINDRKILPLPGVFGGLEGEFIDNFLLYMSLAGIPI